MTQPLTNLVDCIVFLRQNATGVKYLAKRVLQVTDTGREVLDNNGPFLHSSIVSFWIAIAPSSIVSFWITITRSKNRKYHWYTRNVPVFINTGTFQYLGPDYRDSWSSGLVSRLWCSRSPDQYSTGPL